MDRLMENLPWLIGGIGMIAALWFMLRYFFDKPKPPKTDDELIDAIIANESKKPSDQKS